MPDTPVPVSKQIASAPMRRPSDQWQGFHDEIDRMFERMSKGFGFPSLRRAFDMPAFDTSFAPSPAVDVAEDDKAYRITAELPGMSEKEIEVNLSEHTVTLKGEKREQKEQKDKDYHVSERRYGSFQRSFALPPGIDRDKVAASFENGVLTVTLPKTVESQKQQKKIEIKAS